MFPLTSIELEFETASEDPHELVHYQFPEAFDYNYDPITFQFDTETFQPWSHIISYDGAQNLTVDPNLLTPEDIDALREESKFEVKLILIDEKGYKSEVYTLPIEIEIIDPEVEEEEPEKNTASWTPPADFLNRINQQDEDLLLLNETLEEELIEEETNPALIAQITDVSTLGLMTVLFGEGFYPPANHTLEMISQYIEIAVAPHSEITDPSKLEFVWELIEYDNSTGIMLIQVNFTTAIWISTSF